MNEPNRNPNPNSIDAGEERLPPAPRRPDAPHRHYRIEDDRSYYMYPMEDFGPRRETHAKPTPWYNQRWVLVLALMIAVGAIVFALTGLTQEVTGVNASIQEQTAAIEEQTGALESIGRAVTDLKEAVAVGFDRLIDEVRAAAARMGGGSA
ncbi:hypothetical protein FE782_23905 [Paenibacillus antri]|uniref:Uncharacterized protein n=1 Tax=Paenibacillus antri TaxID=2582848 RepID=A0A5R9G5V4_9BACL|nr:hypothetical protein [Paenibacillus antri]TLS49716.1 hypothetical protein FE782_23905 [Paenibacillus antri]